MTGKRGIDRRGFIKASAFGLAGAGTALRAGASQAADVNAGDKPKIKSYRTLGRTGFRVSDIGIGTSQTFPAAIVAAALDAGVNYIDTGEGYGRGAAERSIGDAIKGRDRKSIFITTKVRMDGIAGKDQIVEKVRQALERLQTGYVDCLMPGGLPTAASLKNEHFHQAMDQLRKEGLVRFAGAASHGSRGPGQGDTMDQVLLAAIDDGRFDLVLLVYNFLQKEAGEKILEAAAAKNVATTIMKSNPLGRYFDMKQRAEQMKKDGQPIDERMAGALVEMEETARKAESFLQQNGLKTQAEIKAAALKFVLGDPRVHTLNLAFNTYDDVRDSLALSGTALRPAEKGLLAAFASECGRLYCRHACGICESSCPHSVPVNTIMRYNHYFETQGGEKFAMEKYAGLRTAKADLCRNCAGLCESVCPYGVPVRGLLNLAHAQLTLDDRPFV
jgi:uncharacterized protein